MPGQAGSPRRNEPENDGVVRRDTMRRRLRVGEGVGSLGCKEMSGFGRAEA